MRSTFERLCLICKFHAKSVFGGELADQVAENVRSKRERNTLIFTHVRSARASVVEPGRVRSPFVESNPPLHGCPLCLVSIQYRLEVFLFSFALRDRDSVEHQYVTFLVRFVLFAFDFKHKVKLNDIRSVNLSTVFWT